MTEPPPIGVGSPAFLALFHLPGVMLAEPIMDVGGVWLQRLRWTDWVMVENTDDAFRLYGEFQQAGHVFCSANLDEAEVAGREAEELQETCQNALLVLVAALRVHKTGFVVDPRSSHRYLRVRDLNMRAPGPYGDRLFEFPIEPSYRIDAADLPGIAFLHDRLEKMRSSPDPGVMLALRSFAFSYGLGLSGAQKLAFLFSALEALFGEYRKANRPTPRVTLGAAAAVVSREAISAEVKTFLDGDARSLRNRVAHGDFALAPALDDPMLIRLEATVRDGLRALIAFTSEQQKRVAQLEAVEPGLSLLAPKHAFQKLLGHAAKSSVAAKALVTSLLGSIPPSP